MKSRILSIVLAAGLCAAASAQVRDIDEGLRGQIASGLELTDFTVQSFDLPEANEAFEVRVALDGHPYSIWIEPYSFRNAGATATAVGADGVPREIALPESLTVRGELDLIPDARAAGSRMGGGLHLTISLPGPDGRELWSIQPVRDVAPGADPSLHVVHRAGDVALREDFRCAVEALHGALPPAGDAGTRAFLVCELAFEADFEFYGLNGSNTNNTIADIDAVMARVSAAYEGECNVTFTIPHYNVWTTSGDPYTSTDPSTRLTQFRSWWNANKGSVHRDIAHFMTGANIDGSVIGIAYLSVVCSATQGYGLSQSRYTTNMNSRGALTAHEVGHNFSANHCDGNGDCHIMCSGLGGCNGLGNPARFGVPSATTITNYAANRSCLTEEGIPYPWSEPFVSTTLDTTWWPTNSGGVVNSDAVSEPSEPYSLNLDGTDSINSSDIDLSNVSDQPYVSLRAQHRGVENAKTLLVDYRNFSGTWTTWATVTSDGTDQSTFSTHTLAVPVLDWTDQFAIRIRAQGADATDDWYIDDINVGPFQGNTVPFDELFDSTTFAPTTWLTVTGAEINSNATSEPTEPYSMNLDGTDSAQTQNFLMTDAPFPTYLSFFTQHKGVESGKQLVVEYLNDALVWTAFATITSDGADQSTFAFTQNFLIADAYHDDFAVRFRALGADSTDDWYVDNIHLGDEITPPDDCVADFNGDGTVNTIDVLAFLNAWSAGDSSADVNGDGSVNTLDVLTFLNLWNAGCP